jgi:hypothetical protein
MTIGLRDAVTIGTIGGAAAAIAATGVMKGMDANMASSHPGLAAFLNSPFWYMLPLILVVIGGLSWLLIKPRIAFTAELVLEFYGDGRVPTATKSRNIWRWYFYTSPSVVVTDPSGKPLAMVQTPGLLTLTFEPLVFVTTLRIESKVDIPRWEVKEFNPRFAIVQFAGLLPTCTITASVRPDRQCG